MPSVLSRWQPRGEKRQGSRYRTTLSSSPLHSSQLPCLLRSKGGSLAETCDQVKCGKPSKSETSTVLETANEVQGTGYVLRVTDYEVFNQALERCLTRAWVSHHLARVVPRALALLIVSLNPFIWSYRSEQNAI